MTDDTKHAIDGGSEAAKKIADAIEEDKDDE